MFSYNGDKILRIGGEIGVLPVCQDQLIDQGRVSHGKYTDRPEISAVLYIGFGSQAGAQALGGQLDAELAVSAAEIDWRLDMILVEQLFGGPAGILIGKVQDKRIFRQQFQIHPGIFTAFFWDAFAGQGMFRVQDQQNFFQT